MKLNIGAGGTPLPGYINLDRKTGQEAYPLTMADASCSEIRASHILEHFPHNGIGAVLADWVRCLKPGGVLKIAVPDFEIIARAYLEGHNVPVQGYVMGGQVDADDCHRSIFDAEALAEVMRAAGLVGISRWTSEADDCASLPVSLNLLGVKPGAPPLGKVAAVMSIPRLGFQDNFFCAMGIFPRYGINLLKCQGAFWGQCLTKAMLEAIDTGADWIITMDYDTVFTASHLEQLLSLAQRHPEADAIAPIQAHRQDPTPLMTIKGPDGKPIGNIEADVFDPELTKVNTAHFGLTMIRVSSLLKMPKPWFLGVPNPDGNWGEAKLDEDIYFWKKWEECGFSLYLANRVAIGHMEIMLRWPGRDFCAFHQHPSDFNNNGAPDEVWQ